MTPIIVDPESLRAQPFLEEHETEQDLVVVVTTRGVLLEQLADHRLPEIPIDVGLGIRQDIGHPGVGGVTEPPVHDIDGEPALRPFQDRHGRWLRHTCRCSHFWDPFRTLKVADSRSTYSTISLSRYGTRSSRP